jgi:hypothetical protein
MLNFLVGIRAVNVLQVKVRGGSVGLAMTGATGGGPFGMRGDRDGVSVPGYGVVGNWAGCRLSKVGAFDFSPSDQFLFSIFDFPSSA